jgi:hypothetical protein
VRDAKVVIGALVGGKDLRSGSVGDGESLATTGQPVEAKHVSPLGQFCSGHLIRQFSAASL